MGQKDTGQLHYFGFWATPEEALQRFNREWPYLKEGHTPPPDSISETGCTLRKLCNDFLANREQKVKAGELSGLSFTDYFRTCERMIDHLGKDRRVDDFRPDDFRSFRAALAKRYSAVRLRNEINRVCVVFNYAFENELIDKPLRYGRELDRPSTKSLRTHRNQAGPKLFERDEILSLIESADAHL